MTFATDRNDDEDYQNDGERCIPFYLPFLPVSGFGHSLSLSLSLSLLLASAPFRCTECIFDSAIVMTHMGEREEGANHSLRQLSFVEERAFN